MIHYILQILAFQLLFLVVYDLFLKKETFFNWNRAYLIITPILSFILPFIQVDLIQENIPEEYMIQLPAVLIGGSESPEFILDEVILHTPGYFESFSTSMVFQFLWYLGMVISLFLFSYKIYKIISLKKSGNTTSLKRFNLVSLPDTNIAFSFFNTIFLGETLSEAKKTNILLHEKIHVIEYHSLDLIFFEVLRILFWFNPLVYVYQKRMAMLQEYIADQRAISEVDKKEYYQDLLSQVFQTDKISFINTFFNHSLIKHRIVMLQKSRSKKIFQLKYLLLVPVVCTMLVYTSCTQESIAQTSSETELASGKTTLLQKIDAVHNQIQVQGNISPEEEKALKVLALLVSDDFSNPIHKEAHELVEIPFGVIEKIPVYPGCEGLSQKEAKKCYSQKVSQFVATEFNTKIGEKLDIKGRQKIVVKFKIDNTGKVTNIHARADHSELEQEAIRVVSKLPQMQPGIQEGIPVAVQYSMPIVFDLKE
ncbi:M56 family metallopeptidase [Aquimarina sp. 2201CG5-10]|uniref:M56 family metallopeptidase n=1 Tax=Aquimarina callyspongiae TaxID=3098150 RepID=UPI002AB4A274|nr:M56 family metallopeptidase [Aquimarina sp. 2201CG5-10]MDY8137188.1 M56 family metallopeptidase [Aquimarina sp. 2201CG5-10]